MVFCPRASGISWERLLFPTEFTRVCESTFSRVNIESGNTFSAFYYYVLLLGAGLDPVFKGGGRGLKLWVGLKKDNSSLAQGVEVITNVYFQHQKCTLA